MKNYTAEELQMDLFAPATKHALCPALEKWQAAQNNRLCSTWKNAELNDCGVFTTHSRFYPVGDHSKEIIELQLATVYPYIYGEVSFQTGGPLFYGCAHPLTEDSGILLSINDDLELVRRYLINYVDESIDRDGNLSTKQRERMHNMTSRLVEKAVQDMV